MGGMDENDSFHLLKPLLLALFLFGCFVAVSNMDYAEALTLEAQQKDRQFPAWMVIPYTAVVCDASDSRRKPKCCYYVPNSKGRCVANQGKK